MDRVNLDVARGERLVTTFEVQNDDGTAQNLTGKAVVFVARATINSPTTIVELTSGSANTGGDITVSAAQGSITVTLFGPTTLTLPTSPPPVWSLWLDPEDDDADVIAAGQLMPYQVVVTS